mgnify:FL=1
MQYLDKPFNQVVFFVVISIFLSFSSNLVRKDSIPLLAKKLEITEDIDLDSDESTLLAISLDKAKDFFENGVLFIDARDEVYYNDGHIKNAMKNVFLMELIFNIEDKQTKEDPIVVYCGDPGCGDSEDLAYDLQNEGFKKLFVFKGGWLEWSAANYPSDRFNE